MAELGSHQLDVVNWFLDAHPSRVLASGGIDSYRDGREVFDNITCVYDYKLPARGIGTQPHTVRVGYSTLCDNAYEGAAELIMGTKGSLYLTSAKGLFFQERGPESNNWAGDAAAAVTAGKTLKLSNDPWAHRGKATEIDIGEGNDTREELRSFLDHVRRCDPKTVADARVGLFDCATVLIANEAAISGRPVDFPEL